MDIWNLALNLGAAEAFSLAPQAVEAHWPGTVGDPDALLPGATAVHLLIVPYQTFAWREDEPSVNAFYPAYQNGRNIAQKLVEALNARGVPCETPQVNHRVRPDVAAACQTLTDEGRRSGDAELARACETLAKHLLGRRGGEREALCEAAQALVDEA